MAQAFLPEGRRTVLTVFGTRPEIIKLAPVLRQLELYPKHFRTVNVSSGQHPDLLKPFVNLFKVRIDHDLQVMRPGQALSLLFARVLNQLDPLLEQEKPDLVLVQGDTTTAVASAMAAFHRKIPVGHIEAGLRTDDPMNPFPEETNRRLITRLASLHFAATRQNVRALRNEGTDRKRIFLTGNPVVDALQLIGTSASRSAPLQTLLDETKGYKRIALTTHRRESFGGVLEGNLRVLRTFINRHADTMLIFPVHPNPQVRQNAYALLGEHPRIRLIDPLDYPDFLGLLSESWLIVSDSGGVQEEAPSLGKLLLVLREKTERPEAVEAGVARLVGTPDLLKEALEEIYTAESQGSLRIRENPFGHGDSGQRIVRAIRKAFANPALLQPEQPTSNSPLGVSP